MKVSANMLVAIAARALIPNWNIKGTVMTEVLPVTTLTLLVTKKHRHQDDQLSSPHSCSF